MSQTSLKTTPFHSMHIEAGGKMVDFGGWHMPVRYTGDKKEHNAVREGVGLFDVSHMGEIEVRGPKALDLLQYVTCNDVSKLDPGKIHYNVLMSEEGGFIDDILIYQRAEADYLLVVNASNQHKDFDWIEKHNQNFGAELHYASEDYAQLALQGPNAKLVLQALTDVPVEQIKYYHFVEGRVAGVPTLISRTGYTASDGYELYFAPEYAQKVWSAIMDAGKPHDLHLCGLGARDSLRIEGAMLLYGNDMNEHTTVLEAGLRWVVKLKKGDFIGKEKLLAQKSGTSKKLVGFEMLEFGIPRHGYTVIHNDQEVGEVSSGTLSITLKKPVGLAYVPSELASIGSKFKIQVRKKQLEAQVIPTPFYKRPK